MGMSADHASQESAVSPPPSAGAEPLVSVCIPVYNCEQYLAQAIDSVLTQTYGNFELIIGDNCSTDGTAAIIAQCQDPRVRAVRHESNLGLVGNWNRLMSLVRGKYVKFLCADDFLYPDCLAVQTAILEDPRNQAVAMAFCRRDIVDGRGKRRFTWGFSGRQGRWPGVDIIRKSIRHGTNIVGEPGSVLFRAELLPQVGEFSATASWLVDLDFWSRLLVLGEGYAISRPLCAFRVSPVSWSTQFWRRQVGDFGNFMAVLRKEPKFHVSRLDCLLGGTMARLANLMRLFLYKFVLR